MEQIFSAKSVDEAIELAAKEFGIKKEEVKYEVLEEAKKGLFGKIKSEAKIKAEYDEPRYLAAKNYIEEILTKMGISATLSVTENEDGTGKAVITERYRLHTRGINIKTGIGIPAVNPFLMPVKVNPVHLNRWSDSLYDKVTPIKG